MFWKIVIAAALVTVGAVAAEVTVHYYNMAGVAERALGDAIQTAARAFQAAEVAVRWVDCGAAGGGKCAGERGPLVYELSITGSRENGGAAGLVTLGYSLLVPAGGSVYAKVFLPKVEAYASHADVPVSRALGYAIAHEVGHLVLESGRHSNFGIMQARWGNGDRRLIAGARMGFHGAEARVLRARVSGVKVR